MTDNLFPVNPVVSQYDLTRRAEVPFPSHGPNYETQSSGLRMGVDFIGPGPSTGYELPPPHFPSHSGPPPVFMEGFAEQAIYSYQRNQTQGHGVQAGPPYPEFVQHVPTASRPPWLEYNSVLSAEMPNGGPVSRPPRLPNVPGPSRENSDPDHLQNARAEDLKRLAGQYLNSSGSHVVKFRMKLNRSGGFKVLILLEVDDIM